MARKRQKARDIRSQSVWSVILLFAILFTIGFLVIARMQDDVWTFISLFFVFPVWGMYILSVYDLSPIVGGIVCIAGHFLILTTLAFITSLKFRRKKEYRRKFTKWFFLYWLCGIILWGVALLYVVFGSMFGEERYAEHPDICTVQPPFVCTAFSARTTGNSTTLLLQLMNGRNETLRIQSISLAKSGSCTFSQDPLLPQYFTLFNCTTARVDTGLYLKDKYTLNYLQDGRTMSVSGRVVARVE